MFDMKGLNFGGAEGMLNLSDPNKPMGFAGGLAGSQVGPMGLFGGQISPLGMLGGNFLQKLFGMGASPEIEEQAEMEVGPAAQTQFNPLLPMDFGRY